MALTGNIVGQTPRPLFAMKIKALTSILVATLLTGSAYAQNTASTTAVIPSTPAPVVANLATPAPTPNQYVYTPRLPSVAELSNAAAAQGLAIERIEQSATQIIAVYKYDNGQTNTVAYQTLPPSSSGTVVTAAPAPTVIYESSPRVVYYDDYDPFYYPYWYSPVSVRLGIGFGHRGGFGYRGGFHHGR
jgi:hypothetical protein